MTSGSFQKHFYYYILQYAYQYVYKLFISKQQNQQALMTQISNQTSPKIQVTTRNGEANHNRNFLSDTDISTSQLCRAHQCQCSKIQRKLIALQAKMKKLMDKGLEEASQDTDISVTQQQITHQEPESETTGIQQTINRVNLKEERQMLVSLSQHIEQILKRQQQQKEFLNKILAQQQKLNVFKNERSKSKPTSTYHQSPIKTSSSLPANSPNAKHKDSDILEEVMNLNASINASRVSNDDSERRSQKSDLSGSITSQRRSEISRMTQQQKNVAYASQMKNAKMMAKLKRKK